MTRIRLFSGLSDLKRLTPLACATALLAACGGGSDAAPAVSVPSGSRTVAASAGADARAADLSSLGGWAARAVLSASGDGAFDVTGQQREVPLSRSTGQQTSASPVHARLAFAVARLAQPRVAQRERPAAVTSETVPCLNAGGSMALTFDDADNNQTLSAADQITIVANNCVVDNTLPATNGRLVMRINAVELDADQFPVALDASATATQFGVGAYGLFNGTMRLWFKPEGGRERSRVSYLGATVTYAAGAVVFNFDVYGIGDAVSGSFDIQGGIGIGGQTYTLTTGTVLAGNPTQPPGSGVLSLRDAAGDSVRLTARSAGSFDLDFLPSGSSVPTASLPGLRWNDYLSPPGN